MKFMKTIIITVLIPLFLFGACSTAGSAAEEPQFEPEPQEQETPTEPQDQDETEPELETAVPPSATPAPTDDEEENETTQDAVKTFNETREASGLEGTRADPEEINISPPAGDTDETINEDDDNVKSAKEDLSEKLDVPVEEIEVVNYEQVMWRDGSLGCPDPKSSYIQVIQEGYRIQLSVDGQIYNYHGVFGQPPFLCQR